MRQVLLARRARSTASPMTSPRAATSSGVEVLPSEKRSEPRARASSAPMASRTWLGWATPAVQAEPVEQAMPSPATSRSEEHTSELQSHHDLVCRLLLEKKNQI